MGQIGYFGKIKFHVNFNGKPDILSFDDFSWKTSINVEEHKRQGKKPFLEMVDRNPDEITMQIYLSAYLNQSPMDKWVILRNYCLYAKPYPIYLGGKRLGKHKYIITDVTNKPTEYFKDGRMVATQVSVTFREYSYVEKNTKKTKTSSTKSKNAASSQVSGTAAKKTSSKGYSAYTVKKGDTLWGIAKTKLGAGAKYTKIYNINKTASKGFNKISNPSLIMPGWVIKIPK